MYFDIAIWKRGTIMTKKIIAIICLFAMLLSCIPATATVASAATQQYKVGYAKKSINPFITNEITGKGVPAKYTDADGNLQDYTDLAEHYCEVDIHTSNDPEVTAKVPFISIPLSGYGTQDTRLAKYMSDDNGDGLINAEDGLFVTATYVTDANGNAVIYLNCDLLSAYSDVVNEVRARVIAAINSADKNNTLQHNQIMISGSHNHSGPYVNSLVKPYTTWAEGCNYQPGKRTPDTLYGAYYEYMVSQMTAAVVEAFNNRKNAVMTKGSIDASDAMKEMGYAYTSGKSAGEGYVMNATRHNAVIHKQTITMKPVFGGETKTTEKIYPFSVGNNFGSLASLPALNTEHKTEEYKQVDGTYYKVTTIDYYTADDMVKSDDTLQILRFQREGADPVLLIDWKAHSSMMGSNSKRAVSSDYVNALRYYLEKEGYCVGFWQGAGGNVNGGSYFKDEVVIGSTAETSVGYPSITLNELKTERYSESTTGFYKTYYDTLLADDATAGNDAYRSCVYGYLLGKIALKCLSSNMSGALDMSDIRVLDVEHYLNEQQYSDGWAEASNNLQAEIAAGTSIKYPWTTTVDGVPYVINSKHHAEQLKKRTAPDSTFGNGKRAIYLSVILMGKNVTLVTGSGELFNYYDKNKSRLAEDNDWLELNGDSYGTPFILSHTNENTGYLPNTASYDYQVIHNAEIPEGTISGSYEVNVSNFAQGSGEEVVQLLRQMLEIALKEDSFQKVYCQHCEKEVVWTPVHKQMRYTNFSSGHYYLAEDFNGVGGYSVQEIGTSAKTAAQWKHQQDYKKTVCLDLRGKNYSNSNRCFVVRRYSTLNIMDTVGGSVVQGCSAGNNYVGGTYLAEGNTVTNIYGGTHRFRAIPGVDVQTGWGGVFSSRGTLNIYEGAVIEGADMAISSASSGDYNGCGGAILAYSGTVNIDGSTITSGSVPKDSYGPCIFAATASVKINLSGDADVEDIYFNAVGENSLTIGNDYAGTLGITLNGDIVDGMDIGNLAEGGSIADADITVTNADAAGVYTQDNNLLIKVLDKDYVASINTANGVQLFESLEDAITAAQGDVVTLQKDITDNMILKQSASFDLAGHSITGVFTIRAGNVVYVMDSTTDDFDVSDGVYGKIRVTKYNQDKIFALSADSGLTEDSYLQITEMENDTQYASFHRVNLQIKSMAIRPSVSGLYYNSTFEGDQMVADLIAQNGNDEVDFGVALSVSQTPNAQNLNTVCLYSKFTGFEAGAGANNDATSTLLVNILNQDREDKVNEEYANMKVYGRAFIVLPGGQYFFGKPVARSLRQQAEATDTVWNKLTYVQKTGLQKLYNKYSFMGQWQLPNIKKAVAEDDGVLKILEVGNSHGLDATNLLAEVIRQETGKEVIIGALYYSGCQVKQHAEFMTNNQAVYNYYKNATFTEGVDGINGDGSWKIIKKTVAQTALQDEDWDIITLQQMNNYSGLDKEYVPTIFNDVLNFLKENKKNPEHQPIMLWHMIWANPDDEDLMATSVGKADSWYSWHNKFTGADGKYDLNVLFDNITRCTQSYICTSGDFADVIPAGTAITYALNKLNRPQTEIYRDYTHLTDYSRLIAAYVWYAKIFGLEQITDIQVTEIPSYLHHDKSAYPADLQITAEMKADLIAAVNWALQNPYTVE